MSITDQHRALVTMTDEESTLLQQQGWQTEVIHSLHQRGFRPCRPDYTAARFEGNDMAATLGFIRQTTLPHLHITVEKDTSHRVVLERIDTAIFEAGLSAGHQSLAASFMSFFDRCKKVRVIPDQSLESRLAKLEAANATITSPLSPLTSPL